MYYADEAENTRETAKYQPREYPNTPPTKRESNSSGENLDSTRDETAISSDGEDLDNTSNQVSFPTGLNDGQLLVQERADSQSASTSALETSGDIEILQNGLEDMASSTVTHREFQGILQEQEEINGTPKEENSVGGSEPKVDEESSQEEQRSGPSDGKAHNNGVVKPRNSSVEVDFLAVEETTQMGEIDPTPNLKNRDIAQNEYVERPFHNVMMTPFAEHELDLNLLLSITPGTKTEVGKVMPANSSTEATAPEITNTEFTVSMVKSSGVTPKSVTMEEVEDEDFHPGAHLNCEPAESLGYNGDRYSEDNRGPVSEVLRHRLESEEDQIESDNSYFADNDLFTDWPHSESELDSDSDGPYPSIYRNRQLPPSDRGQEPPITQVERWSFARRGNGIGTDRARGELIPDKGRFEERVVRGREALRSSRPCRCPVIYPI